MIDLTPEHLAKVKRVLAEHAPGYELWAFGSRVNGRAQKNSDLDIAIVKPAKIDWRLIERLKDAFAASDLPFMVDVVDYNSLEEWLIKAIEKEHEIVQMGK